MHTLKDLSTLIESLTVDAKKAGFQLMIEPSNEEGSLFIIANPKTHKAACVGLTDINKQDIIVSYSIRLNKWKYYVTEGFSHDEMSEDPFKSEIFDFKPVDELIDYLK